MSKIADFLSNLNDIELSFLYKYKFNTYLAESQRLIEKELAKRSLDDIKVADYIKGVEFNSSNTGCPRCNSRNIVSQDVQFYNTNRYSGLDNKMRYTSIKDCAICGFNLYDGNEKPIGDRNIWMLLKKVFFNKQK